MELASAELQDGALHTLRRYRCCSAHRASSARAVVEPRLLARECRTHLQKRSSGGPHAGLSTRVTSARVSQRGGDLWRGRLAGHCSHFPPPACPVTIAVAGQMTPAK